jgi:S-DNA-T family DNA segregation ATPase FtsK/SpoIIIE
MSTAASLAGGRPAPGVLTTTALKTGSAGVWRYFALFLHAAAWLFVTLSVLTFSPADPPASTHYPWNSPVANWCGDAGAFLAWYALSALGWGVWVVLALWGLYVFVSAFMAHVAHPAVRFLGVLVMAASVAGAQSLLLPRTGAVPELGGGMVGTLLANDVLGTRFGPAGSLVWLMLAFLVGATVAVDIWVVLAPLWMFRQAKAAAGPTAEAVKTTAGVTAKGVGLIGRLLARLRKDDRARRGDVKSAVDQALGKKKKPKNAPADEKIDEQAGGLGGTESFNPEDHVTKGEDQADQADEAEGEEDEAETDDEAPSAAAAAAAAAGVPAPEEPKTFTPEELRAKIAKLPFRFAGEKKEVATEDNLRDIQNQTDLEGYKFPGIDLLEEPEAGYGAQMEQFVRDQATALERALKEFKIDGEVVGMDSGPVITLYEVRLAPGTKVAALTAVASDLARSLKSVNIRIVPNTAGKDTVGVEVPNPHKEKVRLKELMTKSEVFADMKLPMFLGKDASGNPLIEDLTKMPHMLIAGTTGSGKSVCMSSILMSFLYTKKPNELKLVLVDPKMVELSQFKDVAHLMCPVVTEMGKAAAILEWAVRKMDERYELLMEAGCRDISGYNAMTWEELKERFNPTNEVEEARIPKKLPYMVFVIDELADLMMTNKEVEGSIVRIAQKARAVGIHLILATQRPQANVVTGLIKSNMPCRVAFKVSSGMDSRIVLDHKGGELLLGQGDMLFLSPRSSKLSRAQGTLVDDKEIRRVVKFMKEVASPTFERSLMQIRTGSAGGAGLPDGGDSDSQATNDGLANAQQDPLFDKAVEVVLETKKGSVSLLQRRLAIGYTRASRLIDAMGQAGIVGDHKGTVEREVLITPEEWQAMKAQAAADAANNPPAGQGQLFATGQVEPKGRIIPEPAPALDGSDTSDPFEDDDDTEADDDDQPRRA